MVNQLSKTLYNQRLNFLSAPTVCEKRVIGYYAGTEKSQITIEEVSELTHAVFAFVYMATDGTLMFSNQAQRNRFLKLKELTKNENSTVKMMFSIGGKDNSQNFSPVTASPDRKKSFINAILELLEKYDLDGVDLFWRWPKSDDKDEYAVFLRELKKQLKARRKDYILSVVVAPLDINRWDSKFDIKKIIKHADFISIYGLAKNTTDSESPMFASAWGAASSSMLELPGIQQLTCSNILLTRSL